MIDRQWSFHMINKMINEILNNQKIDRGIRDETTEELEKLRDRLKNKKPLYKVSIRLDPTEENQNYFTYKDVVRMDNTPDGFLMIDTLEKTLYYRKSDISYIKRELQEEEVQDES